MHFATWKWLHIFWFACDANYTALVAITVLSSHIISHWQRTRSPSFSVFFFCFARCIIMVHIALFAVAIAWKIHCEKWMVLSQQANRVETYKKNTKYVLVAGIFHYMCNVTRRDRFRFTILSINPILYIRGLNFFLLFYKWSGALSSMSTMAVVAVHLWCCCWRCWYRCCVESLHVTFINATANISSFLVTLPVVWQRSFILSSMRQVAPPSEAVFKIAQMAVVAVAAYDIPS